MSATWVLLLRGVNVGTAKRVPMATLRSMLADLGFTGVRTLLNSGNAVFDASSDADPAGIAASIEAELAARLGVSTAAIVLPAQRLQAAADEDPFTEVATDPSRLLVGFVGALSDLGALTALMDEDWSPDVFALGEHAAYLWCPHGVAASRLARALAGPRTGVVVTARNRTTVDKLIALAREARG